jgi:TolB-like protein
VVWAFDGYSLDPDRRELRQGTALIKIEPQVFDLLLYLVSHSARVVSKEELFRAIWLGRIVSDSALTTRINAARRAIGDNGKAQRSIRTLPRKGIRFVANVVETTSTQEVASEPPSGTTAIASAAVIGGKPSVAALSFTIMDGDLEQRRFADGLAEEVATALSRFRSLSVVGPLGFGQNNAFDPRRIGSDLGVRYLVRGTVRRSGQQQRVTAQLIDAIKGSHLWADHFDGLLSDGFELQDKISAIIAGSVEPILRNVEAHQYNAFPDRNATPYDLHLRAHPIYSNGKASVLRSLDLLERAVVLDPFYGPALADMAFCLQVLDINGWAEDRSGNRRKAVDFARRALQVSDDPEAVSTAAFACAYFGEDIDAALVLVKDALALNSSFARGWYMSGMTWLYAGRPEQAIESFETSMRLNPRDRLSRRNIAGVALANFFTGRFDEALSRLRVVVQEFPQWATPACALISCHARLGFVTEAEAIATRLKEAEPSLIPNATQFRHEKHRELFAPGLKLAGANEL